MRHLSTLRSCPERLRRFLMPLLLVALSVPLAPIEDVQTESELELIPTLSVGYSNAMGWFGSAGAWFRPTDSVERLKPGATVGLSVGARAVKLDAGVMFYPSYAGIGGGPALIIPYDERPVSIGVDLEVGVVGAHAGVGVYSSFPRLGLLIWRDKIRDKLLYGEYIPEEEEEPSVIFDARAALGYYH